MSVEDELLRLEREYWQLPDLSAVTKRLVALEQGLAASWMYAGYGPSGPPPPNTTFVGLAKGCQTSPGITVTITETSSGTVLWTGTTGVGSTTNYSGSIYLASNTGVTITATALDSSRQTDGTSTFTMMAGSSNSLGTTTMGVKAGYHCDIYAIPLKDTLKLTDNTTGTTYTLTWTNSTVKWQATGMGIEFPVRYGSLGLLIDNQNPNLQSQVGPPSTVNIVWIWTGATNLFFTHNGTFTLIEL